MSYVRVLALLTLGFMGMANASNTQFSENADTGRGTWERSQHGVAVSLSNILPDQARAFYLNRDFSADDAEIFAKSCVFMTVLRNDEAGGVVTFKPQNWSVRSGGKERPPLSIDYWMKQWERRGLTTPQLVAFRWAQFPPDQSYEPGDWNQGMLTTGLPPGTEFDLVARWSVDGKAFETTLEGVRCAP